VEVENPAGRAWRRGRWGDATVPKLGFRLLGTSERAGARGDSGAAARSNGERRCGGVAWQSGAEGRGLPPESGAAVGQGQKGRVVEKEEVRAAAAVVCSRTTGQTQTLPKKGEKFKEGQ
jgi:hypothetical protein